MQGVEGLGEVKTPAKNPRNAQDIGARPRALYPHASIYFNSNRKATDITVSLPRGNYTKKMERGNHRECLREVSRYRHAALDHILLHPTEKYAGDPEHSRIVMMDDSPDDPGVSNARGSFDARGAPRGGPSSPGT